MIRPLLPSEVAIVLSTLWIKYSAHWNLLGWPFRLEIVQPESVSPRDPVASSTNITSNGTAVPPALLALDVEVSVIEGNPTALRKLVDTVAVRVTLATFAVVPWQLGRFAEAAATEIGTMGLVHGTFIDVFATV